MQPLDVWAQGLSLLRRLCPVDFGLFWVAELDAARLELTYGSTTDNNEPITIKPHGQFAVDLPRSH